MKCPHCQAGIEEEMTECPECGESLKTAEEPEEQAPVQADENGDKEVLEEDLTKEDLIKRLREAAAGKPIEGSLPSEKWEDYTASLLEVLFNKHLVFPAEIDRELNPDKKEE